MPRKTRFLFAMVLFSPPLSSHAQTAEEVVKKAIASRGGLERIKAVQAERISGRVTLAKNVEGTVLLELARPHKLHSEIAVDDQKILRVYDGTLGWVLNPFSGNGDVQPIAEEELKRMPEEADLDGPLVDYQAKGTLVELMGKAELEGKSTYRLKLTTKSGEVRSYFLDAQTFLVVKWEGIRKVGDQPMPWESYLSDYREVSGLKFPFKIDQGSPGTDYRQTLTIEKVELNPPIEASHFAKPVVRLPSSAPSPTP